MREVPPCENGIPQDAAKQKCAVVIATGPDGQALIRTAEYKRLARPRAMAKLSHANRVQGKWTIARKGRSALARKRALRAQERIAASVIQQATLNACQWLTGGRGKSAHQNG